MGYYIIKEVWSMIPKIIHYCWFGVHPKPEKIQNFIDEWKEKLPDYQFIEWNEDNFDVKNSIPYVEEAYEAGKFAFVSDYVRLCALANYGGVYLDADSVIIKDFSTLLEGHDMVLCYESKKSICMGFIASRQGNEIIKAVRDAYMSRCFILPNGEYDLKTINQTFTEQLTEKGIPISERIHEERGIQFYTSDFFSGQDLKHGHQNITENTYVVQQLAGSWGEQQTGFVKIKETIKYRVVRRGLQKLLGYKRADRLIDRFRSTIKRK